MHQGTSDSDMYGVMLVEIWPIQAAMPLLENVGRLCSVQFGMARWHFLSTSFYFYSAVIHTQDLRTSKPSRWQIAAMITARLGWPLYSGGSHPQGHFILSSESASSCHLWLQLCKPLKPMALNYKTLCCSDARVLKSLIYHSS